MFREDPRAFATDDLAVAATRLMLDQGWDHDVAGAAKQFVYMPLMHSETLAEHPYRNEVLGRETTPDEQVFLDNGGYRFALEQIPVD